MSVSTIFEPVAYCEGILTMLGDISWALKVIGWIALLAIAAYFLCRFCKRQESFWLSLGIYYLMSMLFVLSGQCPVPFKGFGLSPVAGSFLANVCNSEKPDED
jgi:hypothetical protein